jgi:hypothetical protein
VQDYWSARVVLPVIAVLVEADDRAQGGQVTEIDVSHIDVQDAGAVGGLGQRDCQVGNAAYVDLPGAASETAMTAKPVATRRCGAHRASAGAASADPTMTATLNGNSINPATSELCTRRQAHMGKQ